MTAVTTTTKKLSHFHCVLDGKPRTFAVVSTTAKSVKFAVRFTNVRTGKPTPRS